MVSVIVPNYNHAPYLEQRLESILNQTFQDFEIIILDDCSTDESKNVIEKYRTCPKVREIVYNETNSGSVYQQWKRGIAMAKGELIWIAESDDYCEDSFLKEMTAFFSKFDNLSVAYVQTLGIDDSKKIVFKTESEYIEQIMDSRSFLEKHCLSACSIINASGVLFRKQAYLKINDEFTKYRQCGDWRFWCDMAEQGQVLISGKYLNYYRKHDANATSKTWKEGFHYSEGSGIIKNLIEKHGFSENAIREQVGKMLVLLDKERDFYGKELHKKLLQQVISIRPELIQSMQAALVSRRKKEHIKNIIRNVIRRPFKGVLNF